MDTQVGAIWGKIWPFMTKKRHKKEMYDRKLQYQGNLHKQARLHREGEIELGKEVREISRNMLNVGLIYDDKGDRWRIVVELDAIRMAMCFERGNDGRMIEFIGDQIKFMAEKEIRSCNIQRPEVFRAYRPRYLGGIA